MKLKSALLSSPLSLLLVLNLSLVGQMFVGEVAAQPDMTDPDREIRLGIQDNGEAIELGAGEVVVIELDSNPSAGYIWSPQAVDETALRQRGRARFRPESDLLGAPAKQVLEFEAVDAKSATLNLIYGRPWERELMQGQAGPVFSVFVQGKGAFASPPELTSAPTPEPSPTDGVVSADEPSALALPGSFNWCSQNVCPPVRDQGNCGSCWAFGTTGLLEAQIKLRDNVFKDLAEQYLLSCNTEGWSCSGGWWAHDYHLSKIPPGEPAAGAVYESDFPYVASKVACNPPHDHHEKIVSWQYVGPESGIPSTTAIKEAIYNYGPVAAAVCAETRFSNYTGGIFTQGDSCSGYYGNINHAIILVGWDDSLGIWHLRNSWGPNWGEGGYMRIQYGVANVGYSANYVTYGSTSATATPTATRTPTRTSTPTPTRTSTPTWTRPPGTVYPRAYLPQVEKGIESEPSATPTPSSSLTPSPTFTRTPTHTPTTPAPQSAELLQNRGFESGATIWGQYSSGGYQCIVKDKIVRTGSWSAWLGGYKNADDQVYQTFTVPAWARSARLQFYLYVESEDVDWPYDFFYGKLQTASGSTLQSFFQADNTWKGTNWRLITRDWNDFTAHAGQQRRLFFQGTTDSSLNTNFFVDDVSLVVYSGSLPGASGGNTVELQRDLARESRGIEWKEQTHSHR